jgi:cyclophilin family peptidyl-prolyl cis-trans isomerase
VKFKKISFSFFSLIAIFMSGALVSSVHAAKNPEVNFETSKGSFTLELYPDKAPVTVANFLKYVDDGFYDGTIFHRVIKDFVVQGGGFEKGMKPRETRTSIKSESSNRLKNLRGTISMARRNHPDTATSQFYINLSHNSDLDYKTKYMPGYTVFGKISKGMDVIDKISVVETTKVDRRGDVPVEDVELISAKSVAAKTVAKEDQKKKTTSEQVSFVEGEHYVVLDKPVPTRDSSKVEVIEMFSYGCPHCYEFEPLVKKWASQQSSDIDFWTFPAVWNEPMKLFAQAFYTAQELKVIEKIHHPLFTALVIEHKNIRNKIDLANFFVQHGVDEKDFNTAFNSIAVESLVKQAEAMVRSYKPAGAPEIIINGKYRIDRMRAGGQEEMLAVVDFLVNKERASLIK